MKSSLNTKDKCIVDKDDIITSLKKQINSLQVTITALETESSPYKAELDSLKEQNQDLHSLQSNKSNEIDFLNKRINDLLQQNENLKN